MTINENAQKLQGKRHYILGIEDSRYPMELAVTEDSPGELYAIGNVDALKMPSIAVVGARRATPYGRNCARRFTKVAVEHGFCIVSGGARGIDSEAHRAALEAGGTTVAVLGGGIDRPYPAEHAPLFQDIIDHGGCIVSEREWESEPRPWMFRHRNRITAGLSKAMLVCECGVPSGTFSACEYMLDFDRPVLAVPGAVTAAQSKGPNVLIANGATPIIDDESMIRALEALR